MKKIFFSSALILVALIAFYACNRPDTSPSPRDLSQFAPIPEVLQGASVAGLRLPDGTHTKVINNGATVQFFYPEGIVYVDPDATPKGAELLVESGEGGGGGSYTCTGDCTSGCNVYYVDKQFGCSACGNGNACTGKANRLAASSRGGFLNTRAGIKFLTNKEEAKALYLKAPANLLEIPLVRKAMMEMNKKVYGVEDPTLSISDQDKAKLKTVVVNLFGSIARYKVPETFLEREASRQGRIGAYQSVFLVDPGDGSTSYTCKCEDNPNPGGCTKKTALMYDSCQSGACVSCTMTVN